MPFGTAQGYSAIITPGERTKESDLQVCAHCRHIDFLKSGLGPPKLMIMRADETHYIVDAPRCMNCYQYTCLKKECVEKCTPWEKTLDEEERAARRALLTHRSADNV